MGVKDIMENIGSDDGIKTGTIREKPVFTLRSSDYNDSVYRDIYLDELKNAPVGCIFSAHKSSWCCRDVLCDTMTVLMKNENGVLAHLLTEHSSDDPNPEGWTDEELIWFSYKRD